MDVWSWPRNRSGATCLFGPLSGRSTDSGHRQRAGLTLCDSANTGTKTKNPDEAGALISRQKVQIGSSHPLILAAFSTGLRQFCAGPICGERTGLAMP